MIIVIVELGMTVKQITPIVNVPVVNIAQVLTVFPKKQMDKLAHIIFNVHPEFVTPVAEYV